MFHVVVVQQRQRNVQKRVMQGQSCFANRNLLLFCRSRCRHRRRCLSSLIMIHLAKFVCSLPSFKYLFKREVVLGDKLRAYSKHKRHSVSHKPSITIENTPSVIILLVLLPTTQFIPLLRDWMVLRKMHERLTCFVIYSVSKANTTVQCALRTEYHYY